MNVIYDLKPRRINDLICHYNALLYYYGYDYTVRNYTVFQQIDSIRRHCMKSGIQFDTVRVAPWRYSSPIKSFIFNGEEHTVTDKNFV